MRVRTIKGSPERSASATWAEIDRMVQATLEPAGAVDDTEVEWALGALAGVGPTLVAAGVLVSRPLVLRAMPLELEIRVSLGGAALKGDERLGKVSGAATAVEWGLYVPNPEPFADQVNEVVAAHDVLHAGQAPAERSTASATPPIARVGVDPEALRRISGGTR